MLKIDEKKKEYIAIRKLNEEYLESKLLKAPTEIHVIIETENNEKEKFEELKEKIEDLKYKYVESTDDKYINEILSLKRKHKNFFENIIIW